MTSRISHTSFDASDAFAQSLFWSQVLDFVEDPGDPNEPGHEECLITSRDGSQMLLFITVPERKAVKNRLHLDLGVSGGRAVPIDTRRQRVDAEASRLADLGGAIVGVLNTDGLDHYAVAMKDPEGNEFDIN
jgi:hypothetical protein